MYPIASMLNMMCTPYAGSIVVSVEVKPAGNGWWFQRSLHQTVERVVGKVRGIY